MSDSRQAHHCGPDPIFALQTPLLFAHRGGAREVPESTLVAFEHALKEARSDVLELDVQATRDDQIVVWHGPKLDNVRIGDSVDPSRRERREIQQYQWSELSGQAFVAHPVGEMPDLSRVPRVPERQMLLLKEVLERFPDLPINIELKESIKKRHLAGLVGLLKDRSEQGKILVVSTSRRRIKQFRRLSGDRHASGLSVRGIVSFVLDTFLPLPGGECLAGRALQSHHSRAVTARWMIRRVHRKGGAVHVFLTRFGPLGSLDGEPEELTEEALFRVLDRGVDGIMTDRPAQARPLIDKWRRVRAL